MTSEMLTWSRACSKPCASTNRRCAWSSSTRRAPGWRVGRARPPSTSPGRSPPNSHNLVTRRPDPKGARVDITVSSRHTEVSELLRESTVDKIGRLARFLEGMDRAEVHFSEEHTRRSADKEVCEVTMVGHGHHVRCKVSAPDGFAAVDLAVEKLEHQLHKLKTKLIKRTHSNGKRVNGNGNGNGAAAAVDTDEAEPGRPRIVKTKAFQIKPMTPEE